MSACNRRDHGIELRNWPARCVPRRDNCGVCAGRVFIEWEDAAREVLGEHSVCGCEQQVSAFALGRPSTPESPPKPSRRQKPVRDAGGNGLSVRYRVRSVVEARGLPDGSARRDYEFHPAQRFEVPPDSLGKIELRLVLLLETGLEDCPSLRFHGPAVVGGTHAQLLMQFFIQTYGNARQRLYDSNCSSLQSESRAHFAPPQARQAESSAVEFLRHPPFANR